MRSTSSPFLLISLIFLFFFSTFLGARENELGTNTALIRVLKYAAIGTITIHVMSCVWYSLACANEGAAVEGQIRKVTSCDPDSWAIKLNTGKTSNLSIIKLRLLETKFKNSLG